MLKKVEGAKPSADKKEHRTSWVQEGDMSTPHSNEILISIRPKWVDLIRSGQKIDEIRKTRPARLGATPFYRVYLSDRRRRSGRNVYSAKCNICTGVC